VIVPHKSRWFCGSGEPATLSQIYEEIISSGPSSEIYVGTDSDPSRKKVAFVTGVVIRYPGSGANYYWSRRYIDSSKFFNLGHRLELEVVDSIVVASLLREETGRKKITIHADCSSKPGNASFEFLNRITSYSKAMGFVTVVKPDSWAASSVADKHAKSI
jgi:hypothetical protein